MKTLGDPVFYFSELMFRLCTHREDMMVYVPNLFDDNKFDAVCGWCGTKWLIDRATDRT